MQADGFHKEVVEGTYRSVQKKSKGFIANQNSDVYHPADCYIVEKIKPENRIYFATEEGCWDNLR